MKTNKIIASFLTIFLLLSCFGCADNAETKDKLNADGDSIVKETNKVDMSAAHTVLDTEKYDFYYDKIEDAHPEFLDFTMYTHKFYPAEAEKAYQIGIEGLPVLITKINEFADETLYVGAYDETKFDNVEEWQKKSKAAIQASRYEEFLINCAYMLLRTDGIDTNSVLGKNRNDSFNLLLYESTTDCEKILSGNWSIKEKLIELRRFGLLAIPYVLKEIENGHTEYEEYFTLIGAHMPVYDFAEYSHGDVSAVDSMRGYEQIQNDFRAEKFDYRDWVSENEAQLETLYAFVNVFTACYQPQSNIKYSTFNINNDEY